MKALITVIIVTLILPGSFVWAMEVDENTVLLFTFDEPFDPDVKDVSLNANDGEVGAGVEWSNEGKIGGCAKFTGIGGITVDTSRSLEDINENMTVGFWMRKEEKIPLGESRTIIDKGWEEAGSYYIYLSQHEERDRITLNFVIQGVDSANFQGYPTADEWHYITGTYDGKMVMLYVDGKLKSARAAKGAMIQNSFELKIGTNFVGSLDEVRISNVVRDISEIKKHMEGKEKVVNPNLNLPTTWGSLKSQSSDITHR